MYVPGAISAKMEARTAESFLRQTSFVLYIAIDDVVPTRGNSMAGLDEFAAKLDHHGIPAVWVTTRTRLQLDDPRRKLAHTHPFIAEDGSGVFLPEDYFHLRPQASSAQPKKAATIRLGRFTCLPVADLLPAAEEALEALSAETEISVVPLKNLAPRELAQNLGMPTREAELAKQRDFDALFFFAGASASDIDRFRAAAEQKKIQLRQRGVLWSLAVGASVRRCVGELSKLYDRALHSHARTLAVATVGQEGALFAACDRAILLVDRLKPSVDQHSNRVPTQPRRVMELPLKSPAVWDQIIAAVTARQ